MIINIKNNKILEENINQLKQIPHITTIEQ